MQTTCGPSSFHSQGFLDMSFLVRYLGVSIWNVKSSVKFCWSLHQPSKVKQTIHRNYKTHKICKLLRKNKQKPTNTIYTKHNTHYFYFWTTYSLAYFSTTILNKRNLEKKKKKGSKFLFENCHQKCSFSLNIKALLTQVSFQTEFFSINCLVRTWDW